MYSPGTCRETFYYEDEFGYIVEKLVKYYSGIWNDCNGAAPLPGRQYKRKEKLSREKIIKRFLKYFKERSVSNFNDIDVPAIVQTLLKDILDFREDQINLLMENKLIDVSQQFVKSAREFDSSIGNIEIFQACRNLWAMNWIQLLLDLPVKLTPSIFAYSMLYPYTDNYLDDPKISPQCKREFNERIFLKLSGEHVIPANHNEEIIFNLIYMIENQFDRILYPGVFDSLISIHRAQTKSVILMDSTAALNENELLNISLEKGGTSVLVDGYIVAGELTEVQQRFLFGYGAYLQLVDDIQDINDDFNSGLNTIYSFAGKGGVVDKLIDRTFLFGEKIMSECRFENVSNFRALMDTTIMSSNLLLIQSVGNSKDFYTRYYTKQIEKYSPVRFSFLKKHFKSISGVSELLFQTI